MGGVRVPVHRTEKLSTLTAPSGEPVPQPKSTFASVLVSTGLPERSLLLKY